MRKPNTKCKICKKPIYRRPAQINNNKFGTFCYDCRKEYLKEIAEDRYEKKYIEYITSWKKSEIDGSIGIKIKETSFYIERYIFEKYNFKCAICGWSKINPYTGKLPLEVDHVDGNYLNNKEENLILLCPNCHSLTKTYKGANMGHGREYRRKYPKFNNHIQKNFKKTLNCKDCGSKISFSAKHKRCIKCSRIASRKCIRPTKDELSKIIWEKPTSKLANQFGVSDTAINKWCKAYGISKPPRGYWMKLSAGKILLSDMV